MAPDSATTTLIAVGDPDNWPFDSYTTDIIGVEVFSGTGAQRQAVPAGIIVAGHINGWKIGNEPGTIASPPAPPQTLRLTLERSSAALSFDLGLILVLLALPAAALFVAIQTLAGRQPFLPPIDDLVRRSAFRGDPAAQPVARCAACGRLDRSAGGVVGAARLGGGHGHVRRGVVANATVN